MDDYWCIDHSFFNSLRKSRSVMEILQNSEDDVNLRDKNGWTILHNVVKLGNEAYTEKLLQMGADVNAITSNGFTPLHLACMGKHEECIDVILNYGPSMNVQHSKFSTPLHLYILSGMKNVPLLKKILSKGADPNITDMDGNTALHLLAFRKHTEKMEEFVRLLMEYDADINAINEEGHTPVHAAVNVSCGVLVNVLLQEGADVNIRDNRGNTAITKAFSAPLSSADILMNLGKHLVMQYECNFQVDLDMLNYIIGYEDFMIFKIKCGDELLNLKQKMFPNTTISYYDILIAYPNKLAKCLGNDVILQTLMIFDESEYIFGNRIVRNFKKGLRLHKATEKLREIFNVAFSSRPGLFIDEIIERLDNRTIEKLKQL
ncbi:hypothetical protein WA026_002854 [Henosepilachna vigintioctopunctata]|uniref:Uncharacterized protein n=1 Tax=Henosepilachna vigintioctopunctata TaxID=420089 RepID=A0AAW1U1E0_9CUCU